LLSRSNIKDAKGNDVAIVGVARNITERILIEEEIRTESLKLEERIRQQSEIAIMVSETLQKLLTEGNVDMADRLVSDYLDVSKIDADKVILKPHPFCLATLVSTAVEAFQPLAHEENIKLENRTVIDEMIIEADYDKIALVLVNLLSRAIKFSSPNGHVSICVKKAGQKLSVEIEDDGPPLECNEFHNIVYQSEWIQEQLQTGREDLALGLWIAKKFVEKHGGRLWAENPDTRKNKVYFTIPKSTVQSDVPVTMTSGETT